MGSAPYLDRVYLIQWGPRQDHPQLTGVALRNTARTQNQTSQLRSKWMEWYAGTVPSRQATPSLAQGRGLGTGLSPAKARVGPRDKDCSNQAISQRGCLLPGPQALPPPSPQLPMHPDVCCSAPLSHSGPESPAALATALRPTTLPLPHSVRSLLPGALSISPAGKVAPAP